MTHENLYKYFDIHVNEDLGEKMHVNFYIVSETEKFTKTTYVDILWYVYANFDDSSRSVHIN